MVARIKGRLGLFIIIGIAIIVLVGAGVGAILWYQAAYYISTDNARIDAALVPVGSLNPGQVVSLDVDIGSFVEAGERVAVIEMPSVLNPSGKIGFGSFPTRMAGINAPVSGFVAAVWAEPGSMCYAAWGWAWR